jgi:hypothetical protein
MKVEHRFEVEATCPANGAAITYSVEMVLVRDDVLMVEDIDAEVTRLTEKPVFQEDFTRSLAERFGAMVTTEGKHGRFATRCSAQSVG